MALPELVTVSQNYFEHEQWSLTPSARTLPRQCGMSAGFAQFQIRRLCEHYESNLEIWINLLFSVNFPSHDWANQ